MWKTAAIAVTLVAGTGLAQIIPERNCLSNPNMSGCPGEEQARKIQELMNKKADLSKTPGNIYSSGTSTTQRPQPAVTANPALVQDSDWKRPRLSRSLPADWPRWTFAPSDAGAVIGMKLKVIVQSPILRQIVGTAGVVPTEEFWKNLQVADGPVDEVWLYVRAVAGRPQPESVMLFIGPRLETVGADLRSKGASVCFLDAQSMLAGEWNAVSRALQRVAAPGASGFAQKARELWSKDDIVLIAAGKMISGMLPAGSGASLPAGITGVAVGMSMRETLGIDMVFSVATPADAASLAARLAKNPAGLGAYFEAMSKIDAGPAKNDLAAAAGGSKEAMQRVAQASAAWNATLRTTCVATQIEGGHAKNALPQLAAANVNCRVLPDDSAEYVQTTLNRVIGDDQVSLAISGDVSKGPASPIRQDVLKAVSRLTDTLWPGVPAVPIMVMGATDGLYLRAIGIPTYGVQGFFMDRDDIRFHGRDERMAVASFFEGQTFLYELVKALSGGAE